MKTIKKLRTKKGWSRVELICSVIIICIIIVLLLCGIFGYYIQQLKGEDALMQNTAESVAISNTITTPCPVRGCDGGTTCTHKSADGTYTGYFSHPLNTIGGDLPKGYNSYKTMTIGDKIYHGKAGTMVIKVEAKDGELTLSWVKGR